jgi:uncharacterized repeat protein (TIGR01451 family)
MVQIIMTTLLFIFLIDVRMSLAAPNCKGVLIRLEAPTQSHVDEVIEYRIQIFNTGACQLEGLELINYLPRSSAFESATPAPSSVPDTQAKPGGPLPVPQIRWNRVTMAASDVLEFRARVRVLPPAQTLMTNTSCLEHPSFGRICQEVDTYIQ